MKKFCDPPDFYDPPFSIENDSPLMTVSQAISTQHTHPYFLTTFKTKENTYIPRCVKFLNSISQLILCYHYFHAIRATAYEYYDMRKQNHSMHRKMTACVFLFLAFFSICQYFSKSAYHK